MSVSMILIQKVPASCDIMFLLFLLTQVLDGLLRSTDIKDTDGVF